MFSDFKFHLKILFKKPAATRGVPPSVRGQVSPTRVICGNFSLDFSYSPSKHDYFVFFSISGPTPMRLEVSTLKIKGPGV
jgi:hypothetical protein